MKRSYLKSISVNNDVEFSFLKNIFVDNDVPSQVEKCHIPTLVNQTASNYDTKLSLLFKEK